MKFLRRVCRFVAIILFAIIILRLFVGEPCLVPSESMSPAILPGDRLWVDRTAYGARLPERWAETGFAAINKR